MGNTYGMQERDKTCKEILGTNIFFLWRCDPTRVIASSFLRFSRSHTTHHSRQNSSGRVISSSQKILWILLSIIEEKLDGGYKEGHEQKKPKGRPVGRQEAVESRCRTTQKNVLKPIYTYIYIYIEHNIKMYFEEILLENIGQILTVQDRSS